MNTEQFASLTDAEIEAQRVSPNPDDLIELISDELDIQNPGRAGRIREGINAYREGRDR